MAERLLIQITKRCLFIEDRGVFLRLVPPRLRVDFFFFFVVRLVVRLVFFICLQRAMWIAAYVYVRDPSS